MCNKCAHGYGVIYIGRLGFMLRNNRRTFKEVKLKRKRWITNA